MPTSTTKPAAPKPTALQFNDALEKSKAKIMNELGSSSYAPVAELVCKLMVKYTREELKL